MGRPTSLHNVEAPRTVRAVAESLHAWTCRLCLGMIKASMSPHLTLLQMSCRVGQGRLC